MPAESGNSESIPPSANWSSNAHLQGALEGLNKVTHEAATGQERMGGAESPPGPRALVLRASRTLIGRPHVRCLRAFHSDCPMLETETMGDVLKGSRGCPREPGAQLGGGETVRSDSSADSTGTNGPCARVRPGGTISRGVCSALGLLLG